MSSNEMNLPSSPPAAPERPLAFRLVAIRILWSALALLVLAISFSAIAVSVQQIRTVCTGINCPAGQLTVTEVQGLAALGLPTAVYVWNGTFWAVLVVLSLLVLATLIFWRQPDNPMTILTSFTLLAFFPIFFNGLMQVLVQVEPVWYTPVTVVEALGIWCALIFFFVFPTGKFAPMQARWMLLVASAYALVLLTLTSWINVLDGRTLLDRLLQYSFWGFLLVGLAAQVYRYHYLAGGVERLQTKWVLFGMALFVIEDIAFNLGSLFFPPSAYPAAAPLLYRFIGQALTNFFFLLLIFFLAIAIMRYRLWDIDLLINRTLVYVPLTAILAGLFAATTALLQKIFVALTGQSSDVATALTTLVVVAAFTPIKNKLQSQVDARFKEGHEPARLLQAFQDQLRARYYRVGPTQVTQRLTEQAVAAFNAQGGAVFWGDEKQPSYTCGKWDGVSQLRAAVAAGARTYGIVALGTRRNGHPYSEQDRASLEQAASFVAQIVEQDNAAAM